MKKLFSLLLCLFLLCGCTSTEQEVPVESESELPEEIVQPADTIYIRDAAQLVELIEGIHPCFALDDVPEGYEEAKAAFLESVQHVEDNDTFAWEATAYLASLKDAHTSIHPKRSYTDFSWHYYDGSLRWINDAGNITEGEVTSIGGVPVEMVYEVIDRYVVQENESGKSYIYSRDSKCRQILDLAGCRRTTNEMGQGGYRVCYTENGVEHEVFCRDTPNNHYKNRLAQQKDSSEIIYTEWMGDVFYVDLNTFQLDPSIDLACTEIESAVQNGLSKIILDLRSNGGGNSAVGRQLLQAMGMEVPQYGGVIRTSEYLKTYYSELLPVFFSDEELAYQQLRAEDILEKEIGLETFEPHPETARTNPQIDLIVLTDEETFSSATMTAIWVQDGKLGRVIGQPSRNRPSAYGDVLSFRLNHTGLEGTISYKQFLRPDTEADPEIMELDVTLPVSEDALAVALEMLK